MNCHGLGPRKNERAGRPTSEIICTTVRLWAFVLEWPPPLLRLACHQVSAPVASNDWSGAWEHGWAIGEAASGADHGPGRATESSIRPDEPPSKAGDEDRADREEREELHLEAPKQNGKRKLRGRLAESTPSALTPTIKVVLAV